VSTAVTDSSTFSASLTFIWTITGPVSVAGPDDSPAYLNTT
jgi:hypothetical protein